MTRLRAALAAFLSGLLLMGTAARAQPDGRHTAVEEAAQAAAQEWLGHLEGPDVEDGWEEAAVSFREHTDREAWARNVARLADSLGTPAARTLASARSRDSLRTPAAEGPFVELTYRSRFADGRYEERLLVAREEGTWRVAGYEVRPLPWAASPSRSVRDGPEP